MNKHGFCCDEFEKHLEHFEYDDFEWGVLGCCAGGCYVLSDIKFCPYCGENIERGWGWEPIQQQEN